MTHTYSLVGRLAVTPIVHVLAADIARAFGIVFVLVVIIREELPFGIGNGVVAKDVGGRLGFLPKVVILQIEQSLTLCHSKSKNHMSEKITLQFENLTFDIL